MKKLLKSFVAILTFCLLCVTLFACDGDGKRYKYKDVTIYEEGKDVTVDGEGDNIPDSPDAEPFPFDTMYKDSTIDVTNSKIIWTIKDAKMEMDVKKDGDKYVLSGDYAEQMKQVLGAGAEFAMYGQEDGENFKIVMVEMMDGHTTNINFNFTKA